jgi:Tfp pilus assembly protein PilF
MLAWLGRQLLLVPEAVLLAALLALHSVNGPSPFLALLGLAISLYFAARMGLLMLGRQAMAAADYEQASRMAEAAARLYPASADTHALLGTIHLARGEPAAAVAALARAVVLFPLQAGLHATLSAALLEDGRPQEARASARAALALDERTAAAYLHLAGAETQLGAAAAEVEALLRMGLALPSTPAEEAALRCALAALLGASGRSSEAELALLSAESLLERCPAAQRAGLHFHLGELRRQSGDLERARGHYSASETLDPKGRYAAAAWRAARS